MDGKRRVLQRVSLLCVLLLLAGTFLSFFIAPHVRDARTRRTLGLPDDAFVTDTARSTWVYVNDAGDMTLYADRMIGMKTLRIPLAVNGVRSAQLLTVLGDSKSVETLIVPVGVVAKKFVRWPLRELTALKTLVFDDGFEDLTDCSTGSLVFLEEIYLPKSIKKVQSRLVKDGAAVTVYYAGTEEEWRALGEGAEKLAKNHTVVFETPYASEK